MRPVSSDLDTGTISRLDQISVSFVNKDNGVKLRFSILQENNVIFLASSLGNNAQQRICTFHRQQTNFRIDLLTERQIGAVLEELAV